MGPSCIGYFAADVGYESQAAVWMRVGRVRFASNRDQVSAGNERRSGLKPTFAFSFDYFVSTQQK